MWKAEEGPDGEEGEEDNPMKKDSSTLRTVFTSTLVQARRQMLKAVRVRE
jgi:hypothetical protein